MTRKIKGSSITDSWGGRPWNPRYHLHRNQERNTSRMTLAINQKSLSRFFWMLSVLTILYLSDYIKVLIGIGTLVSANLFQ